MKKPRPANPAKDRQHITALAKGLRVLQCFTTATPEMGISDLARATGMPQPTVWRICYTLQQSGFLIQVPGRSTLRPGIPVLSLGHAVLAGLPVAEMALPHMQAIANQYEGAVSLGARDGLSMVYLQRCQGSAIILADLRVGSRVPLATSATGWAYLAGIAPDERARLMRDMGKALGRQWEEVRPRLVEALEKFEKQGFIVSKGSLHPRINSVAVPLRSKDSSTVLSISSGGISDVFTMPKLMKIGAELQELARKLAPALHPGPGAGDRP